MVPDTGGVYFVPAFTGLGAPYWDMYARGLFCGITRGITKAHIARSVLESIAYQVKDLCETAELDSAPKSRKCVDGGASVSEFLMGFQADMLNINVNRPIQSSPQPSARHLWRVLAAGFWKGLTELSLRKQIYSPEN